MHLLIRDDGFVIPLQLHQQTLEEAMAGLLQSWPAWKIASVHEVDQDQIPKDWTFRDAWRHCPKHGVRHCMETAKGIQKNRIRSRRRGRFKDTDAALVRAFSEGRDASAVKAMIKGLRDAPADERLAAAQTPDQLAGVWPDVLEQDVPDLGGPLPEGAPIDTSGLDAWVGSLNDRLASLEAPKEPVAAMGDVQRLLSIMDALAQKVATMDQRMIKIAAHTDTLMETAVSQSALVQEEVQ